MKTNIEINGFTIKIEDLEGKINITAEKDGEVIDEIVLDTEESEEGGEDLPEGNDEDLKTFDEFDKKEETEESEETESDDNEGEEENEEPENEELKEGLMTFNKFLKK